MIDPAFLSREYNNRELFPDYARHFARWQDGSARARSTMSCALDRAYGASPGETLDVFPARKGDGSALVGHHDICESCRQSSRVERSAGGTMLRSRSPRRESRPKIESADVPCVVRIPASGAKARSGIA